MVKVNDNQYFTKYEIVKDEATGKLYQREVKIKKVLRWRVIFGYLPTDYLIVGEEDLEKVKYAWLTKGVYKAKLSGSEIKRIEPDWRYYTGWSDGYTPKDGDDFAQIKRDMPTELIEGREQIADARVKYILENDRQDLLENIEKVDQLLPEHERPISIGDGKQEDVRKAVGLLAEKFKV